MEHNIICVCNLLITVALKSIEIKEYQRNKQE